jgi:hypothetical protein
MDFEFRGGSLGDMLGVLTGSAGAIGSGRREPKSAPNAPPTIAGFVPRGWGALDDMLVDRLLGGG